MRLPPKRKDENIITPTMMRTIFITAGFFIVVMLGLLVMLKGQPDRPGWFSGDGPWSLESGGSHIAVPAADLQKIGDHKFQIKDTVEDEALRGVRGTVDFTVFQVALFFSIYVFFQVWNQINARSLTPDMNALRGLAQNPVFLAIAGIVAVGQIAIVSFGGTVFHVEPLGFFDWLAVIAFTSSVLIFAEIVRRFRRAQG